MHLMHRRLEFALSIGDVVDQCDCSFHAFEIYNPLLEATVCKQKPGM
jgi:hypothetical protein